MHRGVLRAIPRPWLRVVGIAVGVLCMAALLTLSLGPSHRRSLGASSWKRHKVGAHDVPVFVTDEHQHVLPRWYELAATTRTKGFTLVHIDAHSDMAIPSEYVRKPADIFSSVIDRQILHTSNDEFILEAVHSGLIDRITWIVPDWGADNEGDNFEPYWDNGYVDPDLAALGVGVTAEDNPCECTITGEWWKEGGEAEHWCSDVEEDDIPHTECFLKRIVPLEVVLGSRLGDVGVTLMSAEQQHPPGVILDIDEDYFITEDCVGHLVNAGWRNSSLSAVDDVLMRLCAHNEEDEAELASILRLAATNQAWTADATWKAKAVCQPQDLIHNQLTEFTGADDDDDNGDDDNGESRRRAAQSPGDDGGGGGDDEYDDDYGGDDDDDDDDESENGAPRPRAGSWRGSKKAAKQTAGDIGRNRRHRRTHKSNRLPKPDRRDNQQPQNRGQRRGLLWEKRRLQANADAFDEIIEDFTAAVHTAVSNPPMGFTSDGMLRALLNAGFGVAPLSERPLHTPEFPRQMCIVTGVDQERGSDEDGNPGLYRTNDLVMFRSAHMPDINHDLEELRRGLLRLGIAPYVKLVTVCRSIRDGYLPARVWQHIEKRVLDIVLAVVPNAAVLLDGRPTWH